MLYWLKLVKLVQVSTVTHMVRRLFDSLSGDEGGELDGLSEPTASQQMAPTKAEQSHLIVWQVTTSHDWKNKKSQTVVSTPGPPTNPPHALLEVFNLILLIVLNAWVVDYFVKKKQLFLVHVLYSLFFMNLK